MDKKKFEQIPGTVPSTQNGHLLISSGISSLDSLLGGGLPVGTVALIEEDFHGLYSKVILKYFLVEGITSIHSVFVASQDVNPANIVKLKRLFYVCFALEPLLCWDPKEKLYYWLGFAFSNLIRTLTRNKLFSANAARLESVIRELPAVIDSDPESENPKHGSDANDKMKIAFRYQNLSSLTYESNTKHICHHYDLSKYMSFSDIENCDVYYWSGQRIKNGTNNFSNPAYNDLLKSIKDKIKEGKFFLKDNPEKRTILRIGIHSLGSPMWLPHRKTIHSMDSSRDLDMFIFCLRALVRSAYAVALVTIPSYLYHEMSLERCIHSSDIAMELQSFSGTYLENNQSLSNYHGFFKLNKLAPINSLASRHPGAAEYVFKLRRKKFSIELLHLPPDIQDGHDNKRALSDFGCGPTGKNSLDF